MCGDSDGGDDDVITIGISLPLTGDYSEPGKGVERGYQAWADIINENGGLLDKQVELKILDDKSSADTVVADYEALIANDGVDLVFGPFSTRLVVPSARVASEYGMLFVEPAGAAPEVFEQGFDNLFYAAPAVADDHYNLLAEQILAMPEGERPKTVAYAAMDDPFAMGTAYGLKDKLEEAGVETVVDEVYPPNTTDFSSIAAKIADSKADLVVGGTQYQDAVNLIVALQQLNYQPKMAAFSTAPTNAEFPAAIGKKVEGILVPDGLHHAGRVAVQRRVRPEVHRAQRRTSGRGRGQRLHDRSGRRRRGRGRRLRRAGRLPAGPDRLAPRQRGRDRRRPAVVGRGRASGGRRT